MFTGIIQELGNVKLIQKKGNGLLIQIDASKSTPELQKGGSISINGACQSAIRVDRDSFEALATAETVSKTNFHLLQTGDKVNLELPLTLQEPLGGHLVSGHIDSTSAITNIKPGTESTIMQVEFKTEYNKYLIEKGSVAVDGISLTVFDIKSASFSVSLIPETIENTNLKFRKVGDIVNLEYDLIGKYVEKFFDKGNSSLTMDFLNKHGFTR